MFHCKIHWILRLAGVIDYNFLCFRNAIQQVFELRNKALAAASANNRSSSPTSVNESSTNVPVTQTATIAQNGTVVLAQS